MGHNILYHINVNEEEGHFQSHVELFNPEISN